MNSACKELRCQAIKLAILPHHIHLLLSQPSTISISQIIKQIKGATSHFINQESYLDEKFAFQKGFESYSVSPTNASLIYEYLETQETLHQTISFQEEVMQFREEYKKLVFWK